MITGRNLVGHLESHDHLAVGSLEEVGNLVDHRRLGNLVERNQLE